MSNPGSGRLLQIIRGMAVLLCMAAAMPAAAQNWPARPVKIIVPYGAGGSTDTLTRMLAGRLTQSLGQSFFVENKPGGVTLIGAGEVARSAPDGYTYLLVANDITIVHLTVKTDFDVRRDLLPVTWLRGGVMGLWTSVSLPPNNLQEFIAYAKANPGKLNFSSTGVGSSGQMSFELFKQLAGGLDIVHVPYKGDAFINQALLSGETPIYQGSFLLLSPMRSAGKVKLLATGGNKRASSAPDVPTYREQGLAYNHSYWSGFFAPAKTPMDIARKLQTELKAIYQIPEVNAILTRNGEEVGGQTPEEFSRQIVEETETWARVVKAIGFKPE